MGYFDDPKHREQWEKELSELRQEKARVKAGLPPVSDKAEHSVSRNMEKPFPRMILSARKDSINYPGKPHFLMIFRKNRRKQVLKRLPFPRRSSPKRQT